MSSTCPTRVYRISTACLAYVTSLDKWIVEDEHRAHHTLVCGNEHERRCQIPSDVEACAQVPTHTGMGVGVGVSVNMRVDEGEDVGMGIPHWG